MPSGGTKYAVTENWQRASFISILTIGMGKKKVSILTGNPLLN